MKGKNTAVIEPPATGLSKANGGGTISKPTAPVSRLQGADQDDLILPRVHIFQGLPEERKRYGEFKEGDFINTLTMEKIEARRFAPIFGYKQWIRWAEKRGEGMVYSHREKSQVPPEDLEWDDSAVRREDKPPRAQEYINWVVLIEGDDSPHVFSFTKTSLKAGRTINTLEAMRRDRGIGLYAIELKSKTNDAGTWLQPQIRPAGDPPLEMASLVVEFFNSLSGRPVETNLTAEDAPGEFNPEAY